MIKFLSIIFMLVLFLAGSSKVLAAPAQIEKYVETPQPQTGENNLENAHTVDLKKDEIGNFQFMLFTGTGHELSNECGSRNEVIHNTDIHFRLGHTIYVQRTKGCEDGLESLTIINDMHLKG